ncbi:MAG: hypothetical protein IH936_07505 [Acidobacteria bacterium]|nr:hypothetical protein [Acidobacteriota bacterium]
MAFFNYSTMQMTAKVVYYGPGLCGKTTNLQYIYGHTESDSRGEMVSLETQTDRTLFFDLLPIDVGTVAGFRTKIQLYTVPGQVFYNTTRKLVLKGVDGIVFVADSQIPMAQSNIESLQNLGENLEELGIDIENIPLVLQYNKRDLSEVQSLEELDNSLNSNGWERFEASALTGTGVFETLRGISRRTLMSLRDQLEMTPGGGRAPSPDRAVVTSGPRSSEPSRGSGAAAAPRVAPKVVTAAAAAAPVEPRAPEVNTEPEVSSPRVEPAGKAQVSRPEPAPDPEAETVTSPEFRSPKPVRKDLLLRLPAADFKRTRRLAVRLTLEDSEGQVIRITRDVQLELDPTSTEEVLLSLNLALRSDG